MTERLDGTRVSYLWKDDPLLTEEERQNEIVQLLGLKDFHKDYTNTSHGFFSTVQPGEIFQNLLKHLKASSTEDIKESGSTFKVEFRCKK